MSMVRCGKDSDLYIFEHVAGYVVCFSCPFGGVDKNETFPNGEQRFYNYKDVLPHIRCHVKAGHKVPAYLLSPDMWPDEEVKGGE